ncbi:hypothetical protein BJV78DRAFT_1225289 [Lactifluus subvellereus]|nr:hypothetical protein BJV78DRAFT_1225289 [Lactifluus subvellereus]
MPSARVACLLRKPATLLPPRSFPLRVCVIIILLPIVSNLIRPIKRHFGEGEQGKPEAVGGEQVGSFGSSSCCRRLRCAWMEILTTSPPFPLSNSSWACMALLSCFDNVRHSYIVCRSSITHICPSPNLIRVVHPDTHKSRANGHISSVQKDLLLSFAVTCVPEIECPVTFFTELKGMSILSGMS